MVELDTILIKVASRCNINCSYCYVYNLGDHGWKEMPSQISYETTMAVAAAMDELTQIQTRPFAVVLHGGEPLLLGPKKLGDVVSIIRSKLTPNASVSLQTNGILIDDEILDVCSDHRITLSVSIDGPTHIHDQYRVGHTGEGTYDKVVAGIKRLRNHRNAEYLFSGLLAVIDPKSNPKEIYEFFKDLEAPSVDFIYRDGNHVKLPVGKESLESTEYGEWLSNLLDIYLRDREPIRIRILDDLIKLILGGSGAKDGVGLTNYGVLIIDTDGSITKNDTLKSSFNGADRFLRKWSVHKDTLADVLNSPEFAAYQSLQRPTSATCLSCPELRICGGGMTLQRWNDDNGYDNPSIYCADQQLLISRIRKYVHGIQTGQRAATVIAG